MLRSLVGSDMCIRDSRDKVNAYYLSMISDKCNGKIFNVCGDTPRKMQFFTDKLIEMEQHGFTVIPTAKAASLTMDREGIRKLAAEKLIPDLKELIDAEPKWRSDCIGVMQLIVMMQISHYFKRRN